MEFTNYRFSDFLKATLIAPLVTIPATFLGNLLLLLTSGRTGFIVQSIYQRDLLRFSVSMLALCIISLPSAYISTAIFGGAGIRYANSVNYRITMTTGAVAGILCGGFTGFGWFWFLTRNNFNFSILFEGISGTPIFSIAFSSGLFVGLLYTIILNSSVRSKPNSVKKINRLAAYWHNS